MNVALIRVGLRARDPDDRGKSEAVEEWCLLIESCRGEHGPHEFHFRQFSIARSFVVQSVRVNDVQIVHFDRRAVSRESVLWWIRDDLFRFSNPEHRVYSVKETGVYLDGLTR